MAEMYYYNGHLLPQIVQDENKPFSCILKTTRLPDIMIYQLVQSSVSFYIVGQETTLVLSGINTGNLDAYIYNVAEESWTFGASQELAEDSKYICPLIEIGDYKYELIWTNVDIPNGSPTATEIYLAASEPEPEEDEEWLIWKNTAKRTSNAIREKLGETGDIDPNDWAEKIRGISSGGTELNIHYGDTEPSDTSKLWLKGNEGSVKFNYSFFGTEENKVLEMLTHRLYFSDYDISGFLYKNLFLYQYSGVKKYDIDTCTETNVDFLKEIVTSSSAIIKFALSDDELYMGFTNGSSTIYVYKLDMENETCTLIGSCSMPGTAYDFLGICKINDVIRVLYVRNSSSDYMNMWYCDIDISSGSTLVSQRKEYSSIQAQYMKVYVFGEKAYWYYWTDGTITVLDLSTFVVEKVITLPEELKTICSSFVGLEKIGDYLYMFPYGVTDVYKFNITTNEYSKLNITRHDTYLPIISHSGNTLIFSEYSYYINQVMIKNDLANGNYMLECDNSYGTEVPIAVGEGFTIPVRVNRVWQGNSENYAELFEGAYVYKNGAWTQI